MSSPPPLGQYFYYPVFRRGAAADIPASSADPLHGDLPAARVSPNIALEITASGPQGTKNLTGSPVDQNGNTDLFLYGPGDVLAFDTRHIVRTEPANGTANFEFNYFAGIEFDDPDIPWLFTPAQAGTPASGVAQGGLRPWLVLIVLTSADGYTLTKASSPQALDWIHLSNNPQVLPDLADSWAWVHTQLTGALGSDTLPSLVTNNPQRFVSRLLCPRALQPDTAYTAFLVPAFLAGAQAALPADLPTPSTATDALGPAWNIGDASVNLPVYGSFSFSTGDAGDFMSLAKRLTPQVLTGVGSRPMAVDDARNQSAWNVPAATSGGATLDLHGALDTLTAPGSSPPPDEWSSSDHATFKPELAAVLNVATPVTGNAADPDPVVVPPIYGRYHAAVTSVSATASGWVNELNLDPRVRAAAGLGAEIVTMERAGTHGVCVAADRRHRAREPHPPTGADDARRSAADLSSDVDDGLVRDPADGGLGGIEADRNCERHGNLGRCKLHGLVSDRLEPHSLARALSCFLAAGESARTLAHCAEPDRHERRRTHQRFE